MSISAMVAVRDYSLSTGSDYVVLLMIADQLNDDAHCSWANVDTIATYARIGTSTAYDCIRRLRDRGELICNKKGWRTEYFIPIFPEEPGYDPRPCTEKHVCNRMHTSLSVTRGRKPEPGPRKSRAKHTNLTEEIPAAGKFQESENSGSWKIPDPVNKIPAAGKNIPAAGIDLLMIPYRSLSMENARARVDTPQEKNQNAETDALIPPAPLPPPGPEQRQKWRAIQNELANRGVSSSQLALMSTAHLYGLGPGMWRLYLPRGYDPAMFRSRYEDLISDVLAGIEHRGNQIVEFAS